MKEIRPEDNVPANDNQGPEREAWKRVDRVALTLARIIGRRMAREDFAARVPQTTTGLSCPRIGGRADKE